MLKRLVLLTAVVEQSHWWTKSEWWLVIIAGLTGIFIGWQSWETRKAAKASRDAIILQHRPKIVVRSLRLVQQKEGGFEIRLVLRNGGETTAYVKRSLFEITWMKEGYEDDIRPQKIDPFELIAGESKPFTFTTPEFFVRFAASKMMLDQGTNQEQDVFLSCAGTITYADGIGTMRETDISRLYDFRAERFVLSKDAEADYSD